MKSKVFTLICLLTFNSFHQYCVAQQKGIDDLVAQYQNLLHPPTDEAKNSLTYTQHYLDLKKKIASLGPDNKAAFEQGISKFSSDTGYTALHILLFSEAQGTMDTLQSKDAPKGMNANVVVADSSVQMQVFDKKHKPLGTLLLKPADLENKMKKDGYQITAANYDFDKHNVILTLTRSDGSGTTAKVTIPSTGDVDAKYKLQNGASLVVHSAADGTSSVKVGTQKKK